jgi:ATPase subunit of ABC transporter with duplicated ATPase domains
VNKEKCPIAKNIQDRKDKINFFSNKGGKMRRLASKLRDEVAEDEENMVDVNATTRRSVHLLFGAKVVESIINLSSVGVIVGHKRVQKKFEKNFSVVQKCKSLGQMESAKHIAKELALGESKDAFLTEGRKVGYYQQDFLGLDFDKSVYESLEAVMETNDPENLTLQEVTFCLLQLMKNKVGSLSEGQKGLLCYARFVLQSPALLILDEPTNHINFATSQ